MCMYIDISSSNHHVLSYIAAAAKPFVLMLSDYVSKDIELGTCSNDGISASMEARGKIVI